MRTCTMAPAVVVLVMVSVAFLPTTSRSVDVNGETFNGFSLSVLAPPGQVSPSGPLKVSLETPGTVLANTNLVGQIFAEQNGLPASGGSVNVSTSFGRYQVITTDAKGYAAFSIAVPFIAGAFTVVASGSLGSAVGGDVATVTSVIPNPLAKLALWSDTPVIAPGATATIHALVTDRWGQPIFGAPLSTIPVLALGAIAPAGATTGPTGMANFTYTAPASSDIPNRNLMDPVKISVNMPNTVLPDVSKATYMLGVKNPDVSWQVVRITSIGSGLISPAPVVDTNVSTLLIPQSLTVTVRLTDHSGAPVAGESVTASVSNDSAVSVIPSVAVSDATGYATFQFGASTDESQPVGVSFSVMKAFQSDDSLVILVANSSASGHAMWVDVGPLYGPSRSSFSVTAHVYNATGAPASDTEVDLFSPYSEVGQPPRFAGGNFSTLVGSSWSGITDGTGQATTTATWSTAPSIQGAFLTDSAITVEAGVDGFGPMGAFLLGRPSDTWTLDTAIMARAPPAVLMQGALGVPALTPHDNKATLSFRFANTAGPVAGLSVAIYRGVGDLTPSSGIARKLGDFITSSSGWVNLTYTEPTSGISIPAGFTAVITDNRYALGGQFGSVPFEVIYPYIVDPPILIVTGTTQTKLVPAGATETFHLTVTDTFGKPVAGATISGGSVTDVAGSTGQANLTIATVAGINDVTFTVWTSDGRFGSVQLGTYGGVAVIGLSLLSISDKTPTVGQTVFVNATVSNTGPVAGTIVVDLKVDGTAVYQKTATVAAGSSATVSFVWVPTDTNQHTLTIGTLTGETVAASVPSIGGAGGIDAVVAIGLAVFALIVGLVIGMLLGRRGGGGAKPSAPMPKEEEFESLAEEELPPEL